MIEHKTIIGRIVKVDFGKRAVGVPAKIDTGADGSAVWASKIRVDKDGVLKFALFGEGSPYYNGKIFKRTNYSVVRVRSASGHQTIKYRTHFTITLAGRKIRAVFGLSDRSSLDYPVLIGCRTIRGKFLVDVSRSEPKTRDKIKRIKKNISLNEELSANPVAFYKKYHKPKAKPKAKQKGSKKL